MSLDVAVANVAEQIAPVVRERRMAVAIPDLSGLDGRVSVLGRYIAEDLVTALFGLGVRVVERSLLDRALSELQLGLTDLMNPNEVKRFGRLVGAQGVLVGTITDLGEELKLNVRVVAVETGHVVGAASGVIAKDGRVASMLDQPVPVRSPIRRWIPPTVAPAPQNNIVWQEDFSSYADGDPLPGWGTNVIVRKTAEGRSYLTSQVSGVHPVRQSISFPPDFSFEFDILTKSFPGAWGSSDRFDFRLILVDQKGDELSIELYASSNSGVHVMFPGVQRQFVNGQRTNTVKLVKYGTTYKVYVNGTFAATGTYTDYERFTAIKLSVAPHAFFTNFIVSTLGASQSAE